MTLKIRKVKKSVSAVRKKCSRSTPSAIEEAAVGRMGIPS
jgi:hypothetical protein